MKKDNKTMVSINGSSFKNAIHEVGNIPEIKLSMAFGKNKTYIYDSCESGRIDLEVLNGVCMLLGLNSMDFITDDFKAERERLNEQINTLMAENEALKKQIEEQGGADSAEDIKRLNDALKDARQDNEYLRQQIERQATVIKNQRAMSNAHYGFCEVVRHHMQRMDNEIERIRKLADSEDDTE